VRGLGGSINTLPWLFVGFPLLMRGGKKTGYEGRFELRLACGGSGPFCVYRWKEIRAWFRVGIRVGFEMYAYIG
jgi:hypothetical protein